MRTNQDETLNTVDTQLHTYIKGDSATIDMLRRIRTLLADTKALEQNLQMAVHLERVGSPCPSSDESAL